MVSQVHSPAPSVEIIPMDPLTGVEWDEKVVATRDHTVFHRSAWAKVLVESYGHRPHYLRIDIANEEAALVPLMEVNSPLTGRRGVSLPFSDFAGPLWTGRERDLVYQVLLGVAAERRWKHLEIRGDFPPSPGAPAYQVYEAHELDLSCGILWLEAHLPSATRRAIHKAERCGLSVEVERGSDAIEEFYQLHGRTRRRHGLPPQPIGFFQAIGRHVIDAGLGEIVMARLDGVAVAGAVFFHSAGRAIFKFGASDPAFWEFRPNHLVMWKAIQHLITTGCNSLHFGRTSCEDRGLRRFKNSWGSSEELLSYFRYQESSLGWVANDRHVLESHPFIFGHLPIALNRIAGRIIYPHLD